ncbi:hypothetical protein AB0M22_16970, partial [Nocardia sp. NPDC051756]|uniref:hypothetical protein n=1 Tax=Nocardia sp. NPDC051756 TaxID=3154751 RepID=UPI003423A01F
LFSDSGLLEAITHHIPSSPGDSQCCADLLRPSREAGVSQPSRRVGSHGFSTHANAGMTVRKSVDPAGAELAADDTEHVGIYVSIRNELDRAIADGLVKARRPRSS